MKKLIFLMMFLFCSSANADIIFKGGMAVNDNGIDDENKSNVTWVGIWGETDNCEYCISLFILETYSSNNNPRDRLVGTDYVIKSFENNDGVIRTNLGFAISEEPIQGGEQFNFHFGLSMEAKKAIMGKYSLIFSYDHFSNGMTLFDRDHIEVNVPLDLMSLGIVF